MHTDNAILIQMKRYVYYVLLVAWMGLIFYLSSEGHEASSGRSDAIAHTLQSIGVGGSADLITFLVRKSAHSIAYFVLGCLAVNAFRTHGWRVKTLCAASIAVVVLYAISDELHQLFVPGRSGELRDVLIDSVAGLIGVGICIFIYHKKALQKGQE